MSSDREDDSETKTESENECEGKGEVDVTLFNSVYIRNRTCTHTDIFVTLITK